MNYLSLLIQKYKLFYLPHMSQDFIDILLNSKKKKLSAAIKECPSGIARAELEIATSIKKSGKIDLSSRRAAKISAYYIHFTKKKTPKKISKSVFATVFYEELFCLRPNTDLLIFLLENMTFIDNKVVLPILALEEARHVIFESKDKMNALFGHTITSLLLGVYGYKIVEKDDDGNSSGVESRIDCKTNVFNYMRQKYDYNMTNVISPGCLFMLMDHIVTETKPFVEISKQEIAFANSFMEIDEVIYKRLTSTTLTRK